MLITPVTTPQPAVRLAAPAAAPAQPKVGAKAREGGSVDVSSPDAYRATVVKWVGYVLDAQGRRDAAKSKLDEARTSENAKSRELEGPLVAARQALAQVEAPLAAEVDRRSRALDDARTALDDVMHPQKAQARAFQSQADNVQRDIDGHESSIRSLRRAIENLDPGSSWYASETASLNRQIRDHQDDVDGLSRRRSQLQSQASQAAGVQRDPHEPAVVAARQRVQDAMDAVATAQGKHRDGVAPYTDRVDAAQQAFNRGMAQARAAVTDAQRGVGQADEEVRRVEDSARAVPGKVGFFKRWKWKLMDHFDPKAYFKDQTAKLGL